MYPPRKLRFFAFSLFIPILIYPTGAFSLTRLSSDADIQDVPFALYGYMQPETSMLIVAVGSLLDGVAIRLYIEPIYICLDGSYAPKGFSPA